MMKKADPIYQVVRTQQKKKPLRAAAFFRLAITPARHHVSG
ncbi:hypothetical protein POH93_16085 [Phytobacter diazotrophicus]|nr:hypothetical protein [Phytobacter diazotrophicus]MDC0726904.1 hypothetical protein [Phytobacter diazotrophicus]MDC0734165.1 hypothetical protein [Phytobacter diazotrophicus]